MYYVGDESASSDEYKEIRKKNFVFWQEVMNEDVGVIEGMQKGRSSTAYNGGNFSPVMDTPTLMFHKWVATNLTK
jgi:choline monooxygenase